jgi:hypothetical protein
MSELVGDRATQNCRDLELGVVTLGATHHALVVWRGEERPYLGR